MEEKRVNLKDMDEEEEVVLAIVGEEESMKDYSNNQKEANHH